MSEQIEHIYLCPLHKIKQKGLYRPKFNTILHSTIVNASMMVSQELYRTVKHDCHCIANYKQFDTIIKQESLKSKDSEQTNQ
jgi:hypothetical protein